ANPGSMALSAVRVSDPVLVDNTPPAIEAEYRRNGRTLTITGTVRDRHSKVRDLAYSLDGDEQYQPILPQDLIFDSTSEAFEVTIVDLAPGPHVVTLRASDARRNRTHEAVLVD